MQEYRPPLRDMRFVLFELMQAEARWASLPATAELNRELADAVLEEAGRVSAGLIAPLLRPGDEEGVKFDAGVVTTPAGYKEVWRQFAEGGWVGLTGNPEYGGQGMPKLLAALVEEMQVSAGSAFGLYSILSSGACLLLDAHASDEQRQRYIPPIYRGEWTGVMCLTEAHAGSDLGLIRTRAEPAADGSYRISGSKIFITGGEQDLTSSIVHLVLARLPDAPAGTKGISLFIVPKFLVNDDGSLGARNAVACGSIEHKMGIHAASTCVMNYDGASGWLVGEPGKGLNYMFTMMNYERVTVGLQGLGCAERAYQGSLAYARERLQGRSASNSGAAADPIIQHADVRRMLLTQKALVEAGRAFAAHVALQLDLAKHGSGDEQQRAAAQVALLTPVTKAFLTDKGLEGCLLGQMVFGGHGYIREWGMEQLVRDVRISQIYEGTNGIQALDLLGRKVLADGGRALAALFTEVDGWIDSVRAEPGMSEFLEPLERAVAAFERLSRQLLHGAASDPDLLSASAVDYLHAFGFTLYAWLWARMAQLALAHTGDDSDGFYAAKLETARFFMQRLLPQMFSHCEMAQAGSKTIMALPAERFAF